MFADTRARRTSAVRGQEDLAGMKSGDGEAGGLQGVARARSKAWEWLESRVLTLSCVRAVSGRVQALS